MPEPSKTLTNLIADKVETAALVGLATLNGSITDTEITSLTGGNLGVDASGNLSVDSGTFLPGSVAATGQVTLSGGVATVDTGISATDATFTLGLGIDDPAADCKVAGRLFWVDSVGTYHVEIVEQETSVDPSVNYDILRIR